MKADKLDEGGVDLLGIGEPINFGRIFAPVIKAGTIGVTVLTTLLLAVLFTLVILLLLLFSIERNTRKES